MPFFFFFLFFFFFYFARPLTPTMQRRVPLFPRLCNCPAPCPPRYFGDSHFLPGIGDAQCHLNNNEIPQWCNEAPLALCVLHRCVSMFSSVSSSLPSFFSVSFFLFLLFASKRRYVEESTRAFVLGYYKYKSTRRKKSPRNRNGTVTHFLQIVSAVRSASKKQI